jgi:hypothetical protein
MCAAPKESGGQQSEGDARHYYSQHRNSRAVTFEHYYVDIPIPALFLVLVIVVTGIWTWRRFRCSIRLRRCCFNPGPRSSM